MSNIEKTFNLDEMSDAEAEIMFSSVKSRTRGERRKKDFAKAREKRAKIKHYGFDMYDNLHQYSKNKIHCSCRLCRGKDYFGRHIITTQEIRSADGSREFSRLPDGRCV